MSRKLELILAVLLGAALAALACRNVTGFPGLHGDEAWLGNYAAALNESGVLSPHAMNTYTSPLYGWAMAQELKLFPPSILGLRLPGLALNLLAAFFMAWHLGRSVGRRSALAWLLLLCSSAAFVLKSRVAWEVYALQPILLAGILALGMRMLEREDYSWPPVLTFLALNELGILNHFIFLSVPFSILLAAVANQLILRDSRRGPFLRLAVANMVLAGGLFLGKPAVSPGLWQSHGRLILLLAAAWPAVCAALHGLARGPGWDRWLGCLESESPLAQNGRRTLRAALAAGLGLFFFSHWIALMEIWSGVAIFQRVASWTPPLAMTLALYAWAAFLLGTFFVFALSRLKPQDAAAWPAHERFLVLWPLVYCACFIIFRNTNSIRYYIIADFLLAAALAYILPRAPAWRRRRVWVPMLAGAVLLMACFWRETAAPPYRRPTQFYVGWHLENSLHFSDNSLLIKVMKEERVCDITPREEFTHGPLYFLSGALGSGCDRGKVMEVRFCPDCARAPYFRWEVRRKD